MITTLKTWLSFHDKHNLPTETLGEYEAKALSQDMTVLAFFRSNKGRYYTCEGIATLGILPRGTRYSSYVRAIANLAKAGEILKSDKVPGKAGRPVFTYTYNWGAE